MSDQSVTVDAIEAVFPGDPGATWDYWSGLWNPPEGPDDALVWARLRHRRDQLLRDSDYAGLADFPDGAKKNAIVAYRQALRDLPGTTEDPRQAVWPVAPDA